MKAIGLFHLFMCHAPADAICSKNLTLWQNADNLINTVASNNKNTIVVVHSVGPAIVEAWVNHPNVTALVWAGVAGQEAGNSLVDVLYGTYNPSGRLPYTIAKKESDYGSRVVQGDDNFSEGLFIDYRHFDAEGIEPQYEFGFGLCKFSCLTSSSAFFSLLKPSKSSLVANG